VCQRQSLELSLFGFASAFFRIEQSAHLCFLSAITDRPFFVARLSEPSLKDFHHRADLLSMKRIDFSRAGVVVATSAVIALAGCMNANNNPVSNGNRITAEAKLTAINSEMTVAMTANPASLPQLTQDYITAVQGSETLLGAELAKQKLMATATLLATACSSCAQSLNAAAVQIG
jgi:hypothetical protein